MSSENYNTGAPGALNSWPRSAPALEVEVLRGTVVESRHRVRACIIDREGRLRAAWGDVDAPMLPRSATKPLLACVLAESGALDKQQLTDRELALACASHNGEQEHVRAVRSWLENLGLGEADLACGAHPPFHVPSAAELISRGETPGALHNNCSGKHTGFLSAAVSLGLPIKGYMEPWHPLQMAAAEVLGELTGCAIAGVPEAVDGCGFPQWAISLRGLAAAVARLSDPEGCGFLGEARRGALLRIGRAMAAEPFFVAGTDRLCTLLARETAGRVLGKTGAEGVYAAWLPGSGLGLALKAEDGAERGRDVALLSLLRGLDALDETALAGESPLARFHSPRLRNWAGREVGQIRLAPDQGL